MHEIWEFLHRTLVPLHYISVYDIIVDKSIVLI